MIATAFLIAALVLFILASLGVGSPRFALGWAGLACFIASILLGKL